MPESEEGAKSQEPLRRGDPDPSILTTSALLREIATLKEQTQGLLAAQVQILNTRIEGIEKAIQKASDDYTRVPTLLDREVSQLRSLVDERFKQVSAEIAARKELNAEKFSGIETQFNERDTRTEQISKLSETAINAALAAAEKATSKQAEAFGLAAEKAERGFQKQIDQLTQLTQSGVKSLDDKITDAKERLTRIESAAVGRMETKVETHTSSAFILSVIVACISLVGLLVTLAVRMQSH
jgi:hypothetical protein